MAYQRGARSDFDNWERNFGAQGWNWDEVLKVFKKDECADSDEVSGELRCFNS